MNADTRFIVEGGESNWSWQADYQFYVRSGDTYNLGGLTQGNFLNSSVFQNDDRRLWNLTHVLSEEDDHVIAQRLDRVHIGYTGEKTVLRVGRQAISWGNGLIYNPVDFFNPFDPAAVDKEYKTGDDMAYGQYLQDNGNDWQFVSVWRRDIGGNSGSGVNTQAIKYHAFVGEQELDLLLSRHYEDDVASVGGITSWGGAIIRGDLIGVRTEIDTYWSGVVNLSYSWNFAGKNMSGVVEYFHSGMGAKQEDYAQIVEQPDLAKRLARGELFTIGRDYLAGGISIEVNPLFVLSPNLFFNLGDTSGLMQVSGMYDASQNTRLLLALNLPFGGSGTEFGGLDSGVENLQLSSGPSAFAQMAVYF